MEIKKVTIKGPTYGDVVVSTTGNEALLVGGDPNNQKRYLINLHSGQVIESERDDIDSMILDYERIHATQLKKAATSKMSYSI